MEEIKDKKIEVEWKKGWYDYFLSIVFIVFLILLIMIIVRGV